MVLTFSKLRYDRAIFFNSEGEMQHIRQSAFYSKFNFKKIGVIYPSIKSSFKGFLLV